MSTKNQISYFVKVGGMTINIEQYIHFFMSEAKNSKCEIKKMDFKYGASDWNSGATAYKPYKCFGIFENKGVPMFGKGKEWIVCHGIYEMYQNQIGSINVYFYKDLEEYNNYTVSNEAPYFIDKEY